MSVHFDVVQYFMVSQNGFQGLGKMKVNGIQGKQDHVLGNMTIYLYLCVRAVTFMKISVVYVACTNNYFTTKMYYFNM